MKVKFDDQTFRGIFDPSNDQHFDGVLDDLPAIEPDCAFSLKKVRVGLTAAIQSGHMSRVEWGLSSKAFDLAMGSSVLVQPGLLCYGSHNAREYYPGGSTPYVYSYFDIGGFRDQIDFTNAANTYGIIERVPVRTLHFLIHSQDLVYAEGFDGFSLRLLYDIVTLTTSEQATLFQACGGCC